jgi:hypothetical protein
LLGLTDKQVAKGESNVAPEQHWHATNDHIGDLMELVEGQLAEPSVQRRWRLAMSAFARRAMEVTDVRFEEPILDLVDGWLDGITPIEIVRAVHARHWDGVGKSGSHTADEWARSAVLTAAYPSTARPDSLFDALHWQQAENAFPEPSVEQRVQAAIFKDIFGNPFRPVTFDPRWRSEAAVSLARTAYDTRNFSLLPILADALEEAGCDHPDVLNHCRDRKQVHVRGCWVVDGVLGKT